MGERLADLVCASECASEREERIVWCVCVCLGRQMNCDGVFRGAIFLAHSVLL